MVIVVTVRSMAVLAVLLTSAGRAAADPAVLVTTRWPSVPEGHVLSLEDQITERLTQLGNELGRHLHLLSHDMFQLKVDGRRRRAYVRLGGGDVERLALRLDGDIQFEGTNAYIAARIELALHGHALHLELPTFEMSPAAYRGDYGVEVRLPLLVQKF